MADLQTRLSALITAIGADIKTLVTGIGGDNLVPDPGFEGADTAGGWNINSGTGVKDATRLGDITGTNSFKVITTVDGWGYYGMQGTDVINPSHIVGATYTATLRIYSSTAQNIRMSQYGDNPAVGATVAVAANTWTRLPPVTFVAGTNVYLKPANPAATSLGTFWINAMQIQRGSIATEYTSLPTIARRLNQSNSVVSAAVLNPTGFAARNVFTVTAQSGAINPFTPPSGILVDGNSLVIRIKDNGTPAAITWHALYRSLDTSNMPLPSITVAGKWLHLGFIYNATDSKWDLLAVVKQT